MTSGGSIAGNISQAETLISQAAGSGVDLVVLPENFAVMPAIEKELYQSQETLGDGGPIQSFLATLAKKLNVWILGGTIPIHSEVEMKPFSSSLLYDNQGKLVTRYDKIHLFDVFIEESDESYCESNIISAGGQVSVIDTPFGVIGIAICYDLRFPELFRKMSDLGVDVVLLPAAFTATTGQAHWEALLRARSIENQCYMVAAAQGGYHVNGRETYGHSMIVDPWGSVISLKADNRPGYVSADINLDFIRSTRHSFPVLNHRKKSL